MRPVAALSDASSTHVGPADDPSRVPSAGGGVREAARTGRESDLRDDGVVVRLLMQLQQITEQVTLLPGVLHDTKRQWRATLAWDAADFPRRP